MRYWSDDRWKACLAAGGGSKRRYQYCSDDQERILYLRALQGHSGNNLINPTLQDNVMIERGIFPYIYHMGCSTNLHSITKNGLIPGGPDSNRRQTVFFLPVDPLDNDHQDPEVIDFSMPRLARYVHNAWKRHQDAVYWVDIDLAIRKGLTFYQTRSNAIILQGTLPAYCIPKVVRMRNGQVIYERPYQSPRPPPKISLKPDHIWTKGSKEVGSTVEQPSVGKLVQQSLGEAPVAAVSKLNPKSKPNPNDRSGQPDGETQTSCLQEIGEKRQHAEPNSNDRSGQLDDSSENKHVAQSHDRSGQLDGSSHTHTVEAEVVLDKNRDDAPASVNEFIRADDEEKIDLNIPGILNSSVQYSLKDNVQALIQQIEDHPQRRVLQNDLQQHRQFNPFSNESKDVIKAAGNTELCELLDVEPKTQCKACLAYWDVGIVYCTCGHFLREDISQI